MRLCFIRDRPAGAPAGHDGEKAGGAPGADGGGVVDGVTGADGVTGDRRRTRGGQRCRSGRRSRGQAAHPGRAAHSERATQPGRTGAAPRVPAESTAHFAAHGKHEKEPPLQNGGSPFCPGQFREIYVSMPARTARRTSRVCRSRRRSPRARLRRGRAPSRRSVP